MAGQKFQIVFRDSGSAGYGLATAYQRMRRLLKFALRSCDLRCIECTEVNEDGEAIQPIHQSGQSSQPLVATR